jgi:hypothetical protein
MREFLGAAELSFRGLSEESFEVQGTLLSFSIISSLLDACVPIPRCCTA